MQIVRLIEYSHIIMQASSSSCYLQETLAHGARTQLHVECGCKVGGARIDCIPNRTHMGELRRT